MRPAEFAVEVKKRLRVDLYPRGGFCPFCHETLDVKGDHALLCAAGGDRTIRHMRCGICLHTYAMGRASVRI